MAAANFSYYEGSNARRMERVTIEPSKAEMIERGASYVERAADNAGTFILDAMGYEIGYVPNSAHYPDSEWLYYSSDVKEYYGL